MSMELDALTVQVAGNVAAEKAVISLLTVLTDKIAALVAAGTPVDLVQLNALASDLKASCDALVAATQANTSPVA